VDEETVARVKLEAIKRRWEIEYDELLQSLLERFTFDFECAKKEFNRIASEVMVKAGRQYKGFTAEELQQMWTYIEVNKLRVKREDLQRIIEEQKKEWEKMV
jgi:hypothetical protein